MNLQFVYGYLVGTGVTLVAVGVMWVLGRVVKGGSKGSIAG